MSEAQTRKFEKIYEATLRKQNSEILNFRVVKIQDNLVRKHLVSADEGFAVRNNDKTLSFGVYGDPR